MNYPVWEPFIANSLLIAIIAVVHVFVSHFAIGGGLYLILAETWARAKNDLKHLEYVKKLSRFFVLLTVVFGAVTGVGIWVTIGLIHPTGTKWLINNFVWGWATEWVFFLIEIAAALMYYYGWQRLKPKVHLAIGWIYFIAAWLSLFIINGIVAFMLTPGQWLASGSFWDGFFNPTFWPSLFFRTFICLTLAGLYAGLVVAKEKDINLKKRIMRRNGLFAVVGLLFTIPSGWWYYKAIPAALTGAILPGSIPATAMEIMIITAVILLILTILSFLIFPRHSGYVSASILLLFALVSMGGFEWMRESLRKPFIITDFLYSNHITTAEAANLPADNPLPIAFNSDNRGHDLYLYTCRSCHTIDCYNGLAPSIAGLDAEYLSELMPRLQYFRVAMPPFPGNKPDGIVLAKFILEQAGPDPLEKNKNLPETEKGQIVFNRRCGFCHTMNGHSRPLAESFTDMDSEEASDIIMMIGDLTDQMPPWSGSETELLTLSDYLAGGWQK